MLKVWAGLGAAPNLAGGRSHAHPFLMGAVVEMPQVNLKMEVAKFTSKMENNNQLIMFYCLFLKLVLYMLAVFTADSSVMKAHMMTASTRKV